MLWRRTEKAQRLETTHWSCSYNPHGPCRHYCISTSSQHVCTYTFTFNDICLFTGDRFHRTGVTTSFARRRHSHSGNQSAADSAIA
jgi:hypothetical protein